MTASASKGAFISKFTLAVFDSTGWYEVDYSLAEPTSWGANKGCEFLNIDNCEFPEFCKLTNEPIATSALCDWEATGYGECKVNAFSNTCPIPHHYSNLVCIDPLYMFNNEIR